MDYTGISEFVLLRKLWEKTRPVGIGIQLDKIRAGAIPMDAEIEQAFRRCDNTVYVDYLCGRPLKVTLDTQKKCMHGAHLYDRDAGAGVAESVLAELRTAFPF